MKQEEKQIYAELAKNPLLFALMEEAQTSKHSHISTVTTELKKGKNRNQIATE